MKKMFNHLQAMCMRRSRRYEPLGQTQSGMYFIDCYEGKIYRIAQDHFGRECIATVGFM